MAEQDPAIVAIQEFAKITDVDEGYAHFILQDYDFDLQRGLNAYYQMLEKNEKDSKKSDSTDSDEEDSDVVELSSDSEVEAMDTSGPGPSNALESSAPDEFPDEVTVMTWNVDGIDEGNLQKRFKGVLIVVAKVNPEVILLQEVVPAHMPEIEKLMGKMYHIVAPPDDGMPYFTVTMISKNIKCVKKSILPFGNTMMGRTMTVFEGSWQKLRLVVINSHLESMREYAAARKSQFKQCIKKMEENIGKDTLVVFGGDLNIRDAEIDALNPMIKDAWIAAGSKKDRQYTWDNKLNSNKGLPPNVRCRFDRIYFNGPYKNLDFSLHGTQMIKNIHCYPSDHFAVAVTFKNPPKPNN